MLPRTPSGHRGFGWGNITPNFEVAPWHRLAQTVLLVPFSQIVKKDGFCLQDVTALELRLVIMGVSLNLAKCGKSAKKRR